MNEKTTPEFLIESERFRIARKRLGLTQSQLAEKSGVSFGSIKAYERGLSLPRRQHANKLGAVGINMAYIATGQGSPVITEDMHPAPSMYILQSLPNNPGIHTISQIPATQCLGGDEVPMLDDAALKLLGDRRVQADRDIASILKEINFEAAPYNLCSTVAHLVQHREITLNGARAVLIACKEMVGVHQDSIDYAQKRKTPLSKN